MNLNIQKKKTFYLFIGHLKNMINVRKTNKNVVRQRKQQQQQQIEERI